MSKKPSVYIDHTADELFVDCADDLTYRVSDLIESLVEDGFCPRSAALVDAAWEWSKLWESAHDTTGTLTAQYRINSGFFHCAQPSQRTIERRAIAAYFGG
jgi:hypothetical protein